jgi:hypothetical protein
MVTLEEYKEAAAAARRRANYAGIALAAVLLVSVYAAPLGLALLAKPYLDASIEPCAQWVVRHGIDPDLIPLLGLLVALLVGLPVGLLLALPFGAVWRLILRDARRDRRLLCRHCDAGLGRLAVVTGNCQGCGRRALDLPDEATAAVAGDIQGADHQLLTVEEFKAAVRDRRMGRDPKRRDPRLRCPRCQADLMGRRFLPATRKCPCCEAPILEDPDNTPPAGGLHREQRRLSLAEYRAASEAYLRFTFFPGVVAPVSCLAAVFLVLASKPLLRRLLGPTGFDAVEIAVYVLGLFLVCGGLWLTDRRFRRKWHMECPHCGRPLLPPRQGVVIATRRCYHCGRRALAEEGELVTA